MKYLIIDAQNLLFRSRHVTRGDAFMKSSMALHIVFNSIKSMWNKFDADHVVFCFEGKSWRKDVYKRYKANRAATNLLKNEDEVEEDKIFFEVVNDFKKYIIEKTNCTVLQHDRVEADDLVARWIQKHNQTLHDKANNKFVIISSDSDFQQLIDDNVEIFDGVNQKIFRKNGIFKEDGSPFKDKNGTLLEAPDPEYILFLKCIRGDTSDNIMSAYPGAREKGTKSKIGITEAFEDRNNKGYDWNNFMNQKWTDTHGIDHVVKDSYEENKMLIDLSAQPKEIIELMDKVIDDAREAKKRIPMVGIHFLKFCGQYELEKISQYSNSFVEFLNAPLVK